MADAEYKIEEIDLSTKLDELKLTLPNNLAFFPENIEDAEQSEYFVFTESILDLDKIFKRDNIDVSVLGTNAELYRYRKSVDIYLPAIFFSLSIITQNPTIVSVSLNVLSNYVYDLCRGSTGKRTANVDLYIETKENGVVKKISYNGNPEGLKNLDKIIKAMK